MILKILKNFLEFASKHHSKRFTVVIDVFLFTKVIFLDDEISQIIIQIGANF